MMRSIQIAGRFVVIALILVAVSFSCGSAQETADHAAVVAKLKASLDSFKNENLSNELLPILEQSTEADLGTQLLDAFGAEIKKLGTIAAKKAPDGSSSTKDYDECFGAIDRKAELLQVYYDAIPEKAKADWKSSAASKIARLTDPVANQLKSMEWVRPARQLSFYQKSCFFGTGEIAKGLGELKSNEAFINATCKNLTETETKTETEMENETTENVPKKEVPQFYGQLEEGVRQLLSGATDIGKALPLLKALADSIDYTVEAKRKELADRMGVFAPSVSPAASANNVSSDDGMMQDAVPESQKSPTSATVKTATNINVARLIPLVLRVQMARNLKPLVMKKDDPNHETLLKAWITLSQNEGFEDVLITVAALTTSEMTDAAALSGDMQILAEKVKRNMTRIEVVSVLSDYRSDPRLLPTVFLGPPEFAVQIAYNLGESVLPQLPPLVSDPKAPPATKIAVAQIVEAIGNPDGALFLMPLLLSRDAGVVAAAQSAIGRVGDRRASDMLIKGLANPKAANAIKDTLKKMDPAIQGDVISMFRAEKPDVDKVCIEILQEVGDIRALTALAAVLQRYYNSPVVESLPQPEKSEIIMAAMQAATTIISRNIDKKPPNLSDSLKLSTSDGADSMSSYDSPEMPPTGPPVMSSGMMSESSDAPEKKVVATKMSKEEVKDAPYKWLEGLYRMTTRHLEPSAKIMGEVKSMGTAERVGRELKERVNSEVFRTALNTSEEGLEVYLSDSEIRKLSELKTRAKQAFAKIAAEEKRIGKDKDISARMEEIITGVPRSVSPGQESETGSGKKENRRTLGDRF